MKLKVIFLFFSIVIACLACSKPSSQTDNEAEKVTTEVSKELNSTESDPVSGPTTYSGDNSQTSLDWNGTYFNTLPCASCEGIETWVTLNPDGTFELKTNYLGLNDAREEIFTGSFKWDETGSMITLEGLIGDAPGKYKIGENQIWHLDRNGNRIEGDLADRYILKKL